MRVDPLDPERPPSQGPMIPCPCPVAPLTGQGTAGVLLRDAGRKTPEGPQPGCAPGYANGNDAGLRAGAGTLAPAPDRVQAIVM